MFQKLKSYLVSSLFEQKNTPELMAKTEYNKIEKIKQTTNKNKQEKMYFLKGELTESQAYITYNATYQSQYLKYVEMAKKNNKYKTEDGENKIKTNYKDMFLLSINALLLPLTEFKYVSVHANMEIAYLFNHIMQNKMMDFFIPFKKFAYEEKLIPVNMDLLVFEDNSILCKIKIEDTDFCQKLMDFMKNQRENLMEFIAEHQKVLKSNMDKVIEGNPNIEKDLYKQEGFKNIYQSTMVYTGNYSLLLESLINGGLFIDITDIAKLISHVKIKSVRFQNTANNHKTYTNIANQEDLVSELKAKNMMIKIEKKENKNE